MTVAGRLMYAGILIDVPALGADDDHEKSTLFFVTVLTSPRRDEVRTIGEMKSR